MKVLWVSSAPIGPVSRILELPYGGSSGTWIQAEYEALGKTDSIEMYFLCPVKSIGFAQIVEKSSAEGVAFGIGFNPKISFGKRLPDKIISQIEDVITKINPDIIHIWGSESSFSATVATLCPEIPKVIFIQGLIGMHYRYMQPGYVRENKYWGNLSILQRIKRLLKQKYYNKHIALEQAAITKAGNIITDNMFTHAYCDSFARPRYYNHFMYPNNEYYKSEWSIKEAEKNSIFTIFAGDPSKGLAQLLKAVNIVSKSIPDVKLYIPGPFTLDSNGKIDSKHCNAFERWVYNYISEHKLWANVVFTGRLGLDQMKAHYLKCNVFVSPSCMEVHSASVREAMAIGTPTISSMCGSIVEYINHERNGLIYRFEEEEVLAMYILRIFSDDNLASEFGRQARISMAKDSRQDSSILEIYKAIVQ